MASFTKYEILITFKNFAGVQGSKTIKFETLSTESLDINIDSIIDKKFFSRNIINAVAIVSHLNCASGLVTKISDDININW